MKRPIIVIPARMGSTRLPSKPLLLINSIPMIIQVVKRSQEADIAHVLVAAAEKEIYDCVKDYGVDAVMTDPNLNSGSDRVKSALDTFDPEKKYNVILNVQGDLPTIEQKCILDTLDCLTQDQYDFDISTLVVPIKNKKEASNPNVVKAVVSWKDKGVGEALYFTRAQAPYGEGDLYHHIGIYGYKREALEKFTSLKPSMLEQREKLEQLRALENRMRIGVKITDTVPIGVDTLEDLKSAEQFIKKHDM